MYFKKIKINFFFATLILFSLIVPVQINAQTTLTVDVAKGLNDVSRKPIGINMDYLMDGDYITPAPPIGTTDALRNLGVKILRYPGGEKSDNYLWSVAPWDKANPRFARTGSCEWPTGDTRFANTDYTTMKSNVLDFDEFMTMSNSLGAKPLIVVAYDAMYKASACGGKVPTRAELLTNAEEWVRYANIKKGYNIKYWMIGNESYMSCNYNGCASASQYRDDVIEFSKRMKAIDPTIKIIANGDGNAWWSTVLPTAAAHIDYIGISNYPVWQFGGGYNYYRDNNHNFTAGVNNALNAVNSYAPSTERARIKIITTEYNANDWSGQWADANDVGHALASFEVLGQHLKNNKVEAAIFWNTRWINNLTNSNDIFDAINKKGFPNPNGLALSIWGNNLLDKMVTASSTTKIKSFATYKPSASQLNIFIINKETSGRKINLSLLNFPANAKGDKWVFKGTGPTDINPTWFKATDVSVTGNTLPVYLPASSIVMIRVSTGALLPGNREIETEEVAAAGSDTAATGSAPIIRIREKFEVYPNPVSDVLKIHVASRQLEDTELSAFSIDGRQMFNKKIKEPRMDYNLNVSNWPQGMYILRLTMGKEQICKKILVR